MSERALASGTLPRGEVVIGGMTTAEVDALGRFARAFAFHVDKQGNKVSLSAWQAVGAKPYKVHIYTWGEGAEPKVSIGWTEGRVGNTFQRGDYSSVEWHTFGVKPPEGH